MTTMTYITIYANILTIDTETIEETARVIIADMETEDIKAMTKTEWNNIAEDNIMNIITLNGEELDGMYDTTEGTKFLATVAKALTTALVKEAKKA
jgi:hypothetical protein